MKLLQISSILLLTVFLSLLVCFANASDASFNLSAYKDNGALDKEAKEWNNKGYEFLKNGNYNEAIDAYDQALKIYPNNTVYLLYKAEALFTSSQYEKSLEIYQKAFNLSVGGNPKGLARDGIKNSKEKLNLP